MAKVDEDYLGMESNQMQETTHIQHFIQDLRDKRRMNQLKIPKWLARGEVIDDR